MPLAFPCPRPHIKPRPRPTHLANLRLPLQGILARLTKSITLLPSELGDGPSAREFDAEADVPEVVLFDPDTYPEALPESTRPYAKVSVFPFMAAKLRPHQVAGVRGGKGGSAVVVCACTYSCMSMNVVLPNI
jgi:hypothetical protein